MSASTLASSLAFALSLSPWSFASAIPDRVPEHPLEVLSEGDEILAWILVPDGVLELPQVVHEAALPPDADVVPCAPGVAYHDPSVVSDDLLGDVLPPGPVHLVYHGPPAQEGPEPVVLALDPPAGLVPVDAGLPPQLFLQLLVPGPESLGHRHHAVEHRRLREVEVEEELQERPDLLVG